MLSLFLIAEKMKKSVNEGGMFDHAMRPEFSRASSVLVHQMC